MNEIQEIEARLAAATPGPWDFETIPETGESRVFVRSNTGDPMLDVSVAPHGVRAEDAEFIAYAPEDIRALIAEVKRLEAWKREAVTVMDGLQGLGEALRLPLGEQVTGRTALEKVKELIKSRDAWASHMMGIAVTRQKLEAVEALHAKQTDSEVPEEKSWCGECRDAFGISLFWPCPTMRALGVTEQ